MKILTFEGGFDKNFSYLIWCNHTKIAGIVDPSVNITPIIDRIEKDNLKLRKIFITHTHHDHISHLDQVMYLFPNSEILCFEKYVKRFEYNITKLIDCETIALGNELIVCLYTPGHYSDSVCYWNQKHKIIFTGDTIFVGRTGRTINSRSNILDLYDSVYNKVLKLPHDTIIFPGHNYGFSKTISIKDNILYSDFFSCKSRQEFEYVMKKFESNYR